MSRTTPLTSHGSGGSPVDFVEPWPSRVQELPRRHAAEGLDDATSPNGPTRPGEYADYARPDIDRVAGDDAIAALETQLSATLALLTPLDDVAVAGLTYAPGTWTLKEVVAHVADDERIFAYRVLRVARGDHTPLPGFDEKLYATTSGAEHRTIAELLEEYTTVRRATLSVLRGLPPAAWTRRAIVNGYEATPRGLAFHIAGHELRHVTAPREKYLARSRS